MGNNRKYVVLDDTLYSQYHNFKTSNDSKSYSKDRIGKILRFSGNEILTNLAQIERLDIKIDTTYLSQLRKDSKRKYSLEELAKHTRYKIILTDDPSKSRFPYVSLENDEIEMVLGGFFVRNSSREKAIEHLNSICRDVRRVTIYDKYFSADKRLQSNVDVLCSILPTTRTVELTYHSKSNESHFTEECKRKISEKASQWSFKETVLDDHHDRYLVLDNKVEVILTGGFDHLGRVDKEISYIVRNYQGRF